MDNSFQGPKACPIFYGQRTPTKRGQLICLSRFERAWKGTLELPLNERPWIRPLGTRVTIGKSGHFMPPSELATVDKIVLPSSSNVMARRFSSSSWDAGSFISYKV
jgi:hypothetical protein